MTFNSNITDLTGYCIMRRKNGILVIIFGLANFFPPSATSRGSIPSSVLLIVPPVCFTLHLHTAEHEAK